MAFKFEVVGSIYPKQRPRARICGGYARIYTPAQTQDYEALIRQCAMLAGRHEEIIDSAFSVDIIAYFAVPKSYSKKKRQSMIDEGWCCNSKDIDNIAKIVLDSLNGYIYTDDHKCVSLRVRKKWADNGIERLEVIID